MSNLKGRVIKIEAAIGGREHEFRVLSRIGVAGLTKMIDALKSYDGPEGEFDPPEPIRTWFEQVLPFVCDKSAGYYPLKKRNPNE